MICYRNVVEKPEEGAVREGLTGSIQVGIPDAMVSKLL